MGLGLEPKDLTFIQISLRAIIVFLVSLVVIRVANRRFLAKMSAFDTLLGFILASMLARAVNGSAAFFPTLGAGFVLVALHAVIASLSFRWAWIGLLVKGRSGILVKNGTVDPVLMRRHKIPEHDLMEEARLHGAVLELGDIRQATIERNGQVSVVPVE
jgi:uncharacterized membrane protein YcaP (DUF421 family)